MVYNEVQGLVDKLDEEQKTKDSLVKILMSAKDSLSYWKEKRREELVNNRISERMEQRQSPFDSVSIREDQRYGRYLLVANRDFKAGEVIYFIYLSQITTEALCTAVIVWPFHGR